MVASKQRAHEVGVHVERHAGCLIRIDHVVLLHEVWI